MANRLDSWLQVKAIFHAALEQPDTDRAAFIRAQAHGDASIVDDVESLLRSHSLSDTFLEHPVAAPASVGAGRWIPQRVGPYRIVRAIGAGGMGAVYLARRDDETFDKQVAIKVIGTSGATPVAIERFRHERQILANLDHPHIARLLDGGSSADGLPYVVMELVAGVPIDRYADEHRLSVDDRLRLFAQVCGAVHYAHQRLVIHRDLKPSNILVTDEGVPKLLDFGIAKLLDGAATSATDVTGTGYRMLTPECASPEQLRGETMTTASDVYALGVLLHRLLSGGSPYPPGLQAPHDVARAICEDPPSPPSQVASGAALAARLSGDLDTIVLKALQKDPARRYGSAEQFAHDLDRHLKGLPVLARPDTIRYRARKFMARHRTGVAAGAFACLLVATAFVATAWEAHVARLERSRAERRFNDVRTLANSVLFEFHDAIAGLPGSTKARELLVRRALQYLDNLASESSGDRSLQRELAEAFEKVGDVQGLQGAANLGDTTGALASHRKALALRESLASAAPADLDLQRDLALTYRHIGMILIVKYESREALEYERRALAAGERLLAARAQDVGARRFVASMYQSISGTLSLIDDADGALTNAQSATAMFESLLASDRSNARAQRDVSVSYKYLGARLERKGDYLGALANYRKSVAIDETRLAADSDDNQTRLDLSFGYASVGAVTANHGDVATAVESYRRALALREQASASDPHDANARDAVGRAHLSLGQVWLAAPDPSQALRHFQQALSIVSARSDEDPANNTLRERLATVHRGIGEAYAAMAARDRSGAAVQWRRARAAYSKSLDIWTGLRSAGAISGFFAQEPARVAELLADCDRALRDVERGRATPTR